MRIFALLALALLVAACSSTSPPRSSYAVAPPNAAYAPSADVRATQQQLRAAGMYDGPIDGVWGPETRAAVERFQQNRGLPVTGRVDDQTTSALRRPYSASPVALRDPTDVRTVQNRLRQLNYYQGPDDGVWGSSTQMAIESFQHSRGLPVGQVTEATIAAMGLDPASFSRNAAYAGPDRYYGSYNGSTALDPAVVRGVQQRLRQAGFYSGPIDGVWGSRTQTALERFQRSRNLEATGTLNPTTAQALGLNPNNLSLSAVPPRRY